jgi:hypothetical protein
MYLGVSKLELFAFGTALVTAFMVSKIVLIGELLGLGRSSENQPLILAALHKAAAFALLYLAFHGLEGAIDNFRHGRGFLAGFQTAFVTETGGLLLLGLVAFFSAIPFFALREVRRVLGVDSFRDLVLGTGLSRGNAQFSVGDPSR